eukprot:2889192-Rhodomonas_salina.4
MTASTHDGRAHAHKRLLWRKPANVAEVAGIKRAQLSSFPSLPPSSLRSPSRIYAAPRPAFPAAHPEMSPGKPRGSTPGTRFCVRKGCRAARTASSSRSS